MAELGGRVELGGAPRGQAVLALGTSGLLVWTLLTGMPDAVRIAICAATLGSLLIVRSIGGPWLAYTGAFVASLVGLLALRVPGVELRAQLAVWASFIAVGTMMLYFVSRIRAQQKDPDRERQRPERARTGNRIPGLGGATKADYGVAVVAPFCGAAMVFYLTTGMAPLVRAVLMLTILGVLLHGVIARRHWLAYAAATVAVLAALASATTPLPAAAVAEQWIAFASVVGVVLYLVARVRSQDDDLRSADDMKSRFIALTNHELRTPVAVLYSVLETLEEDLEHTLSPQQLSFLSAARASSHALAERVELLTQLHHLQQESAPDPRTATLGEVLREVTKDLGGGERNVAFRLILSEEAAATILPQMDSSIVLRQVLSNAVKFSPPNAMVDVSARLAGSELVCEIVDEGPGIPAGLESMIFEPFYQPGNLLRREADGLGIGLSLARLASRRMGATVTVRNQPAGGTCVALRVPASAQVPVPFPSRSQRVLPA